MSRRLDGGSNKMQMPACGAGFAGGGGRHALDEIDQVVLVAEAEEADS